jgi:ABC-type nitrate/sulfonate/bicarbonate transport system substrate-binding protein
MYETAQPLMEALCGDKIDVAGYTAFQIAMTAQQSSGKDLYYSTAMMEDDTHPISMFIVKKDSDIKDFADFKGKTIGILPTLAYKSWAEMIMKENGIFDDVTIENVAPNMQVDALKSGEVDILFTNDPVATTVIQKGLGKNLFEGAIVTQYTWTPYPFASFNMTSDFVDKNPETATSIVKALDEAINFINSNQAEAKEIMAKYLPDAQKDFVSFYPDSLYVPSTGFLSADLTNVADSYFEIGSISKKMDLSERALSAQ